MHEIGKGRHLMMIWLTAYWGVIKWSWKEWIENFHLTQKYL